MNKSAPLFNPMDPAFVRDPYPFYRMLRESAPVWKSPMGVWVLTRYDDIAKVLKDNSFVHDFTAEISDPRNRRALAEEPVYKSLGHSMLLRDPPEHTRLRGLVVRAFTARRVEEMRPRIEQIVASLLDPIAASGAMDVIDDFAHKLPVIVICDMLGIPEEDRAQFLSPEFRISGRAVDPTPMTRAELDLVNRNIERNRVYFSGLFKRRREEPGDDLTSALLQVSDEKDGRLSEDELYANVSLLFNAGHETTTNLIGNGLLALHRNPDQWKLLVDDPTLAQGAVEELLRYDSSVQLTARKASRDCEIAGNAVRRGDDVMCLLGAANRDPAAYDEPEKLDIRRKNVRPLSFGGGIHTCLGAQLARLEGEIAFRALATRFPNMKLENLDNPAWRPTITLRRLEHLPARW
ncbi:MAG: cytochrome P450 [Hyphomicrobiales bacterium]|nr:cytochrome P450 [Hyphomicrobiales bacterium]